MKPDNNIEQKFKCDICEKICTTVSNLSKHRKYIHECSLKEYKCNICDTIFSSQSNLDRHSANFHENKKPYICDECKKPFTILANLNSHIKKKSCKIKSFQM